MNKSLYKLTTQEQISFLQRYIIIHSIIYYEFNNGVISDRQYDEYAKYLYKLILSNNKEFTNSQYYYVYYDYNPATGFDLRSRLTKEDNEYLTKLALNILHNGNKIIEKGRK